jgi:hypothetical protein
MATKQEQPEGKSKAETKSKLLKKMAFAVQAKREGRLSAEDFKAMNVQLRSSPMIRRPITIFDTDPYDSIITADSDETDMIHMYDTDLTDRFFR